jgi:transcriptional regulator
MYVPAHFVEADAAALAEFIEAHSFGTRVTVTAGKPFASHAPFLYDREAGVPTWNYAVVHVYGAGRIVDDAVATARHVEALAAKYERGSASPWVPSYDPRRLAGIVGIEIRVREMEGKFKLSQNRSGADHAGVVAQLSASGSDNDAALAALMMAAGTKPPSR